MGGGLPEQVPRGFEASKVAGAVDVDEEARRRREAWDKKPEILGAKPKEDDKPKAVSSAASTCVPRATC